LRISRLNHRIYALYAESDAWDVIYSGDDHDIRSEIRYQRDVGCDDRWYYILCTV
jgi:hypothetical protein